MWQKLQQQKLLMPRPEPSMGDSTAADGEDALVERPSREGNRRTSTRFSQARKRTSCLKAYSDRSSQTLERIHQLNLLGESNSALCLDCESNLEVAQDLQAQLRTAPQELDPLKGWVVLAARNGTPIFTVPLHLTPSCSTRSLA
jgi:hypothetical protein